MQLLCTFVFDLSVVVLSFENNIHNKNPRLLASRSYKNNILPPWLGQESLSPTDLQTTYCRLGWDRRAYHLQFYKQSGDSVKSPIHFKENRKRDYVIISAMKEIKIKEDADTLYK